MQAQHLNGNPNFIASDPNDRVIVCPRGRSNSVHWRAVLVGRPYDLQAVASWDDYSTDFDLAIESQHPGIVRPCRIEITGRTMRRFSGIYGFAARITFPFDSPVDAIIPHDASRAQA